MSAALSKRLDALEAIVAKGVASFIEVGNALAEIRDSDLYKFQHSTFEEYCVERWGFERNYANKLIRASGTVAALGTTVPKPTSEGQVRPLAKLTDPDDQREAWSIANEASNGKPTAKDVEAAVEKVLIPKRPFPEPALTPAEVERVAQAEKDSEILWTLKSYWKRATKKDRTEFRAWINK